MQWVRRQLDIASQSGRRLLDAARTARRRSRAPFALICIPALVLCLGAPSAQAVSLGSFEVQSALGERLRMIVQVTTRPDEQIDANCFKVSPFNVSTDGLPQLTSAQVVLERGNGARLLISTRAPLNDPIFRLSIEVGCETALRRDLTVLLDPLPAIDNFAETPAPASAASPAPSTPPAPARAESPAPADASGSASAGAGSPAAAGSARAPGAETAAAPARRTASAATGSKGAESVSRVAPSREAAAARPALRREGAPRAPMPSVAARGTVRDRLTISTSGPSDQTSAAPLTPHLTLATTLSDRTGQPPLPESVLSIIRQKQARLRAAPASEDMPSIEAEIVILQKRTAELRSQLDSAMAQMQLLASKQAAADANAPAKALDAAATPVQSLPDPAATPQNRFDSRWLFGSLLLLLLALFTAALVVWVRRERAERRRQDRWNQSPYVPVTRVSTVVPPLRPDLATAGESDPAASTQAARPPAMDFTRKTERPPLPESYAFTPFSTPHAANQLGVSDLAQATEKASVFVTLGRPEQAIDVLRDHIDHEPKPSPMAWLMLVDLYRQTGQRAEFADVAKRFHSMFNAETPQWEQQTGRTDEGLAAFPHLIGQIRRDWPRSDALAFIESLLYDNRGGERIGFSLPAFRDLLLLHSLLEEYLIEAAARAKDDGEETPVRDVPQPPAHLAKVWASAPGPAEKREPKLELDVSLLSDSPDCSALERGLPVVADAIVSRWGKPGAADYLTNLIALSKDDRNSDVSSEMMGELLMLQDVACVLEESRARDLSY